MEDKVTTGIFSLIVAVVAGIFAYAKGKLSSDTASDANDKNAFISQFDSIHDAYKDIIKTLKDQMSDLKNELSDTQQDRDKWKNKAMELEAIMLGGEQA